MARLARCSCVFTRQMERRCVMIEGGRAPAISRVTALARVADAAVDVIGIYGGFEIRSMTLVTA
jgi:hypothetical protein